VLFFVLFICLKLFDCVKVSFFVSLGLFVLVNCLQNDLVVRASKALNFLIVLMHTLIS